MEASASRRGRRRQFSSPTRKLRKSERDRGRRKLLVNLGSEKTRWDAVREAEGLDTDQKVAGCLLNFWYANRNIGNQLRPSSAHISPAWTDTTVSLESPARMLVESPMVTHMDENPLPPELMASPSVHSRGDGDRGEDHEEEEEDEEEEDEEEEDEEDDESVSMYSPSMYSPSAQSIIEMEADSPFIGTLVDTRIEEEGLVEETEEEEDFADVPEEHVRTIRSCLQEQLVICGQDCLQQLAKEDPNPFCHRCGASTTIRFKTRGTAPVLQWLCPNNHTCKVWCGQQRFSGGMSTGDVALSSSILLSGNNFDKVEQLFKVMRMSCVNKSTHYKLQSHYTCPAIHESFMKEEASVLAKFKGQEVIIAGDGRCDSPGFCAKYLTYTVMHALTWEILLMRVYDKRQANLKTTQLEGMALRDALNTLKTAGVVVKELVTDAHVGITKMMREEFPEIKHSYDIWHASKNLTKKLKAECLKAKNKGLKPWVGEIRNHLWYSAKECGGSVERFAEIFTGCLNHCVGIHTWGLEGCLHPTDESENHPAYLPPGEDAHKALTRVVCNTRFQAKFPYFVNARTTSRLESFQNVILQYASKRFAYKFPAFRARCQLAVLDYRNNYERPAQYNQEGVPVCHRKYSKHSERWTASQVKAPKQITFLNDLLQQTMEAKAGDSLPSARKNTTMLLDPINIAPTVAPIPPPATRELMEAKFSRFK